MKTPRIQIAITAASIPLAFFFLSLTARALTVSSTALLPTSGVNINNSDGRSVGLQARYTKADDQRSLGQTFIWNSDLTMSGLGLLIAADQGSDGKKFTTAQSYYLDIQKLDNSYSSRTVQETITTVQFTLTTDLVNPGKFLYVTFTTPLSLTNGTAYGFNLRPGEMISNNVLAIDQSAVDYLNGVAGANTTSIIPNGTAYAKSGSGYDLTFFTTTAAAVPEPATTVVSLGAAAILLGIILRRCQRR